MFSWIRPYQPSCTGYRTPKLTRRSVLAPSEIKMPNACNFKKHTTRPIRAWADTQKVELNHWHVNPIWSPSPEPSEVIHAKLAWDQRSTNWANPALQHGRTFLQRKEESKKKGCECFVGMFFTTKKMEDDLHNFFMFRFLSVKQILCDSGCFFRRAEEN